MYPRTQYEMTEADLEKILDACKPVPYMIIGGVVSFGPQENANLAWAELGQRMGFDHMTVRPTDQGDRFFTAIPSETPELKAERLEREKKEEVLTEIKKLKFEIEQRQSRLSELETTCSL